MNVQIKPFIGIIKFKKQNLLFYHQFQSLFMILEVEKGTTNKIVIEKKNLRFSLFSKYGKFLGAISIIAGFLALLFSIAPYFIIGSAFIFWLLYPFSALSIISSVLACMAHQIWQPTLGIILSISSVIIGLLSGEIYVLGMAGSVNEMTETAKTFIDALKWPF